MNPTTKKWLTGCGIGCGAVVVLAIVSLVGGSFFLMGPFRDAIATRETLDEQYGDQAAYTPPADGAVAAERVEAFLVVRAAVAELCDEFTDTAAQFERMEELGEDASTREGLGEGLKLTREVIGMMPRLGQLYQVRNATLAEVGMGLGEYTYIYMMAYGGRLVPGAAGGGALFGESVASSRIRGILREMLQRQLAALDEAARQGADFGGLHGQLDEEILRLSEDHGRLPWQDGLPSALAASLDPFRERLDAGFCAAVATIELNQNRQRGLSIQGS